MIPSLVAVVAWRPLLFTPPLTPHKNVTHRIDPSTCAAVVPTSAITNFRTPLDCAQVHRAWTRALDAWSRQAPDALRFVPTPHRDEADIVLRGGSLARYDKAVGLASVVYGPVDDEFATALHVTLDEEQCWTASRRFCHGVVAHGWWHAILLGLACFLAPLACVLPCLLRAFRPYRRRRTVAAILGLAWFGAVLTGLLVWYVLGPCVDCHDLEAVLMHEVGHVLGLDHVEPNGHETHKCGCGPHAHVCPYDGDRAPLMIHTTAFRPRLCLSQDDADGVRSLYAPEACRRPVACDDRRDDHEPIVSRVLVAVSLAAAVGLAAAVWR